MADPNSPAKHNGPSSFSIGDLGLKFDVMIDLMKSHIAIVTEQSKTQTEQSKTQKEQSQLLRDHSKMLEALERDATRDDKPYEGRGLRDESTWGALDKEALAKIKITVDGWKDLMNVSLIFIALFLTVVTAFISPIIQLFSTPSSTKSKPPLPPTSLQLVALFYYLALMCSICNSVMCVLGLQWAGRLLSVSLGKTNLERALNRERRKVLAERRLLPLMGVLFWTLLLSIGSFVIGFLIQFWALSFSFAESAPILIIGAASATALAITILGVILATTYHATVHKNSPFESPLSSASIAVWAWLKRAMGRRGADSKKKRRAAWRWYHHVVPIKYLSSLKHCARGFSRWIVGKLPLSQRLPSHESSEEEEDAQDESAPVLEEEKSIGALTKENQNDDESVQALKAYARLVINTNDAEVLERTMPSFEFGEWCRSGAELVSVFLAVRERFLATDTSFRVKETMNKQLVYCRQWSGWRQDRWSWKKDLQENVITRWCRDQCKDLVGRSRESHRQFLTAFVFFTSLDPDNEDLRGNPWDDSYEKCVARVLSSFDRDGQLGDREDVFESAVNECRDLLRDGRSDDFTRILSSGDRSSILRSLLQNSIFLWRGIEELVAFITRRNEVAVLRELADFFSNLPDSKPVYKDLYAITFLGSLIPSLPSTFSVPQSFDLTSALSLFLRYQSDIDTSLLLRYCDILLYFLEHGGFEVLSSLGPAHSFLQLCLTIPANDNVQSTKYQDRARFFLEPHWGLIALPQPSPQELQNLVNGLVTYQHSTTLEDPKGMFVDAVKECDHLCREGNQAEIKDFLSPVDRVSLLGLILQDPGLSGRHILGLLPLIIEGNALEHVQAAPVLLTKVPPTARSDGDLPVLAFLAALIPFLPSDYIVTPDLDLSRTLALFVSSDPHEQTWRKYSDALIHYLHRGAFDAVSDQDAVREFLEICIDQYPGVMRNWHAAQRTSESTREQAMELKEQLKELDAGAAV
ncbi:hypothetical protein SISSUDRAFT_1063963 [Sistotremastrum suecicum HHB10207 ss-3]|uniref:DUF6535 domain-containing protein n=1 Tax=Sistotremastrum suecicum HHB10207 ss-3 TaxID=1314776 RepID=A0A166B6P5_9AGAM|nr:hypothetical protein SISSUDRAFT_1063963 [Sistotremastrum suecicum HHB10207 ss-3]